MTTTGRRPRALERVLHAALMAAGPVNVPMLPLQEPFAANSCEYAVKSRLSSAAVFHEQPLDGLM